ncbi:MAG TPA: RNA polymerase sigma-70 factor [Ramlibacter sp.]|uniref:RNA polymerase sigma-70 factor n=1 Tax=Ramlibacter sp. TaxID=1917967 RepID=UPI002ED65674
MDHRTATFQSHRPRLLGIAYRMLGSTAEAEDVLQDAWLRWNESDTDSLRSVEAWLVTIVTRLSIDRLRALRAERDRYPGFWLPEPVVEAADAHTPHSLLERADDVSVALLRVLEQLGPDERAAFVLRQAFDMDYAEIAQALGKSEAACRQLVHRASERVQAERPRFAVSGDAHWRVVEAFARAAQGGDLVAMRGLLAEDAQLVSDGGGKVRSFDFVMHGAQRLAQLYYAVSRRHGASLHYRLVRVNGQPGLARYVGNQLESVQSFEFEGERIRAIQTQRNPDKLARVLVTRP